MSNNQEEQQVPKWFKGKIYPNGETVTNPFSGESYKLTAVEVSIYDAIMGGQMLIELLGGPFDPRTKSIQETMRKGLDWFRQNNAEAYMVLLD